MIKFTLKFTQVAWGLNIKFSRNGSDHVLYLFTDLEIANLFEVKLNIIMI